MAHDPLEAVNEGQIVEFKAAFTWNPRLEREDGDLRLGTVRTVAGFANTSGGTLFIGVSDGGKIHGIDDEARILFGESHLDQYEALILESFKNALWPNPSRFYEISFEQRISRWLCIVRVEACPGVTYVRQKAGSGAYSHDLYIRTGNRTVKLIDLDRDRFVAGRFGGTWSC